MRDSRLRSTEFYEYTNVNPHNKICGDCVIRAIALITGQSWEQTIRELTELGLKKGYVCNDVKLYPLYLKSKGFVECNEPRDVCNRKMSVKEWLIEEQVDYDLVANVGSHHVTAIKNGKVRDIWNCSTQTIHKYWVRGR